MHGRLTDTQVAPGVRPTCSDCLFSPECSAWTRNGESGDPGMEVTARILHRGDRLFHQGARFDSIYMVRSGAVKACAANRCGDEQVTGFYTPGNLVGLDAIQNGRHVSSAIALETTSVCCLDYETLCRMSGRFPHVLRRLLAKMSQRIRANERRLAMLAMRGANQRMASFLVGLVDISRCRGLQRNEILLPMSRADIASYLVLAVETVSRSLSSQREAGLIEVRRNRIRILDETALRALAGAVDEEGAQEARGFRIAS